MEDQPKLLRDNGVPEASDVKQNQTVDDLAHATRNGDPAIAHVDNHDGTSHVVTVRGVQNNPDGTRNVIVQDPAPAYGGKTTSVPESEFNKHFTGHTITTNKD
jgi:filamentous hemagglutinin